MGDDSDDSILRRVAVAPALRAPRHEITVLIARPEHGDELAALAAAAREVVKGRGAVEELDGFVCVPFERTSVTTAASCALALHRAFSAARLALCRDADPALPSTRAAIIERAHGLFGAPCDGVVIDDAIAADLGARFEVGRTSSAGSSSAIGAPPRRPPLPQSRRLSS